jgi:hypothetical protein
MTARVEAFEPCDKSAITAAGYQATATGAEGWLVVVLLVLVAACTVFVAYIRLMPMYRRRNVMSRRNKVLDNEFDADAEDEVIRVAWGGRAYKDDPDAPDGNYKDEPSRELELNGRKFKGEKFYTVNVIA